MKLYLDMCCLKRPFDDQTDPRIQVETAAVESILQMCREGAHTLVASDALQFENGRNPNLERKEYADFILALARHDIPHSAAIEQNAQKWQNAGVEMLDAFHLASAELIGADVFASCDDVLLKRARRISSAVRVLSILDLFGELVP